ncbi:PKD domain-containing protein [Candidatus Gracilibacteria bacterium]|nr:PKD domain-containing protein [Candidatus Gracilibacteria bacterium]
MKKLLYGLSFLLIFPVWAQEIAPAEETPAFEEERIIPQILVDAFVEVGKKVLFDASSTKKIALTNGAPVYSWDFGDESRMQWGEKIAHSYERPGRYTVSLSVRQGRERETVVKDIVIFDKKGVFVSDNEAFIDIVSQAGEHGIWLQSIPYEKAETGFSAEEDFIRRLQEKVEFLRESDVIIFSTQSFSGLQSFAQFWRKLSEEKKFDLASKLLVQVSDVSLEKASKLMQPIFSILHPQFILLTRPEALNPIFEQAGYGGEVIEKIKARGIEYRIIDERSSTSPFLVLSKLTTYFVSHGISQNVVYLLLAVPFIVFVISFLRQFVGFSTFGVYAPLMLALSFLVLGLKFGFFVFSVVMLVSYLIRLLFEKVELLYIPKVSLLLSLLSLSFFLVLGIAAVYFDSTINLSLTIFPMLVMATLSEKFLSAQSTEGTRLALLTAGETVLVSFIGYAFITWGWMESAILAMPESILLPIFGNVWLGRFTGLRLSEYIKFRALFREESTEEEEE